jgi:putative transposase
VLLVRGQLNGNLDEHPGVSDRTLRLWVQRYKAAEQACGDGFVGLLPQIRNRGNRTRRLPESTRTLMDLSIAEDYEAAKQKRRYECWAVLKQRCIEKAIPFPCYSTYCEAVKGRSAHTQTRKRLGPRAAYTSKEFYWSLDQHTPRHGDRPFEIAHIDHTEVDVELVCAETSRLLSRPWWTVMTDAFSRRVLAMVLSFEPPSYRSCMAVLRDCVRRHGRLPQILIVDCGPEFRSVYFESLLARFECTKKTRPPAQARFGSVCERLFGTANTQFFHNLRGNTQVTRHVRQVTKQNDPAQSATWTLLDLFEHLCEYVFEVYDAIERPALGESPRSAFLRGLADGGARLHRIIPYDDDFVMTTLPTTVKGSAKVSPGRGFKLHNLWYWSDTFRSPTVENTSVPVRYDPFDVGTAYAYVQKQWVKCHSEQYLVLKGRSEKEIMLASAELIRRGRSSSQARFTVTAARLAAFLKATELEEEFLVQRLRERNQALVRGVQNEASPTATEPVAEPNHGDIDVNETFEIYGEF